MKNHRRDQGLGIRDWAAPIPNNHQSLFSEEFLINGWPFTSGWMKISRKDAKPAKFLFLLCIFAPLRETVLYFQRNSSLTGGSPAVG
ncbi:MAG TPA: hypothetical protein PKH77_02540 [Anaerolineae bacterium]|nr:hypothetical protein [Anaerolineae bacterium]